jgi:hypothetical protein
VFEGFWQQPVQEFVQDDRFWILIPLTFIRLDVYYPLHYVGCYFLLLI